MAGELFDVASVFGTILKTPEQQRAEALDRNLGLFGAGLGGALADTITNLEVSGRAGLNQALSAINPNLDIRTPQQRFTEAINNINPEDPDAEAKYIEATRTFAPERLPELVGNLRRMRMEDAEEARRAAEEARRVDEASRAATRASELTEQHNLQIRRNTILADLEQLDLDNAQQAEEAVPSMIDYIKSTTYGMGTYGEVIDNMSPQQVQDAFNKTKDIEGVISEGLRDSIRTALPDSDLLEHLDVLGQGQLQSIMSGIMQREITPSTQVYGDSTNGYSMVIQNPSDPANSEVVPLIAGTPRPERIRALPNKIKDTISGYANDVDNAWLWGTDAIARPDGTTAKPKELIQGLAESQYQRNPNMTNAEFEDRIRAGVNQLVNMPMSSINYNTIVNAINNQFQAKDAASLISEAMGN